MKKPAQPVRTLTAGSVAAWRLARQRLTKPAARNPEAVARDLVGVQAQVLSSAALSIALRTGGRVAATSTALENRQLIRSWGMRGTLHLFAADDFPTVVAALSLREPWRRPSWLRYFGTTEKEMEAGIEAVGEILDDGLPRTRAALADDLHARFGPRLAELVRGSWGMFLKQAANKGHASQAWTGDSSVAFVRPDRWLRAWRTEDPEAAIRALLPRYLAAYGSASVTEINRWWGVTGAGLKLVIRELAGELTEVEVDGGRGLVRTEDLDALAAATLPPGDDGVRLLGPFDPLTIGGGLRAQLIRSTHLKRVSRTAGWISPVVLIDGRVAGVWDSARNGDRLTITIDLFLKQGRRERAAIERAAQRVATTQGSTAVIEHGPVFSATRDSGHKHGDGDPS